MNKAETLNILYLIRRAMDNKGYLTPLMSRDTDEIKHIAQIDADKKKDALDYAISVLEDE